MATDPQVLFCVVMTLLLPLRFHTTLSPIQEKLRQPFGSIRLNAAWNVLCVTLSVLACRRWGIEMWQRGLRGMVALAGREVLRTVCSLPYIRGIVRREVAKELKAIEVSIHGNGDPTAVLELPKQGLPREEILRRIQLASAAEAAEYDARLHGQRAGALSCLPITIPLGCKSASHGCLCQGGRRQKVGGYLPLAGGGTGGSPEQGLGHLQLLQHLV